MSVLFKELLGKTITSIEGMQQYSEKVLFTCSDGKKYCMLHNQDCCEMVNLEDFEGDYNALLNTPILLAEESISTEGCEPTAMWTFYKLATVKGDVTLRWLGESEHYSIDVDFEEV